MRPLPDHMDALRRLSLRTGFMAVPLAAAGLAVVSLVNNLLGTGLAWFDQHQVALASYVAAGLFAASLSVVTSLELPDTRTPRPRSPLEGLRLPRTGTGADKGRTGAIPLLVLACAAVAGAVAAVVSVCVLQAKDLGGPGAVRPAGPRADRRHRGRHPTAPRMLPSLSRRRLLALATAFTGVALLAAGGPGRLHRAVHRGARGRRAGVPPTGHTLLDQEARTTGGRGRPSICTPSSAVVALGALWPRSWRARSDRTGAENGSSCSRTAVPRSR